MITLLYTDIENNEIKGIFVDRGWVYENYKTLLLDEDKKNY